MRKIILIAFFIVVYFISAFSQKIKTQNDEIKFSVCQPTITESGRQSSFHFNYRYRITTDENGDVKGLKTISDFKDYRSLMNDENLIPCIKKWRLKPSEKFMITISVGTTGKNSFQIANKTMNIVILL
jgi:hypothetical protein